METKEENNYLTVSQNDIQILVISSCDFAV